MRIKRVLPYVYRYPRCSLLDIGCGWECRLLRTLEPYIGKGVGIDFKAPRLSSQRLKTHSMIIDKTLPFEDATFDLVTMLAVLEHLSHPQAIMKEIARILRPGGGLLLTAPSWYAKPLLEFLAFRLGVLNAEEIRDHKRYYNREDLYNLVQSIPELNIERHEYFQWRFNNLLFVTKEI